MYTVILVDDQPLCLRGMESSFDWKKYGFEVIYKTTNPETALEMIKELNPDVVCTDMRMPYISGIDLVKAAKILDIKAKFVIISGYEDFKMACEAIQYNVFRYCLKPINRQNTESILGELKNVLDAENSPENQSGEDGVSIQTEKDIYNPKFQKIVLYINEHYMEDMTLGELAEKFRINVSFASRLFSQRFGEGYSQYLNSIRLRKAAELLASTTVPIAEIAYAVGFKDPAYFDRVFKKKYGETPYVYRARKN